MLCKAKMTSARVGGRAKSNPTEGRVALQRELTDGERRVLLAYCELETHAEAAKALDISTQTLKNHLGSIYKKVGARKAHSAVYKLALENGRDPITGQQVGMALTNGTEPEVSTE